jgi:hypothetical protein
VLIHIYWALAPVSDETVGTSWNATVFVGLLARAHPHLRGAGASCPGGSHRLSAAGEVHDYRDPWSAAHGLSMTERLTIRPDHVRTSLVSTPHREGRVASRSFLSPL